MKNIFKNLKPFKVPLLVMFGLLSVYVILSKAIPAIQYAKANKSPIVSIMASNDNIYDQGETILAEDFTVKAKHKNGQTSIVRTNDLKLSKTRPETTGKETELTITIKEKENLKTSIKVKNRRDKITSVYCGNPKLKAVKAVLYSNGELAFEGKGDVLQFDRGSFPWRDFDGTITAITFEDSVTPVSLDYWFESMRDLKYIAPLPKSVESIVGYCIGCENLREASDWSQCKNLLDITKAYADCEILQIVPPIPNTVRNATEAFAGCDSMQDAPDMTDALSLINTTGMYRDCKKMTTTNMVPAAEIMDAMYENCINLKKMPEIADTAISMSSMFSGNISMATATRIPKNVQNISGCFKDCRKLTGELIIEGNPKNYGSFLAGASNATKLDLKGKSTMLNILALTNDGVNITINGAIPVKEE